MLALRIAESHRPRTSSAPPSRSTAAHDSSVRRRSAKVRARSTISVLVAVAAWLLGWVLRIRRYIREAWNRSRNQHRGVRQVLLKVEAGVHASSKAHSGIMSIVFGVLAFRGKSKTSVISSACRAALELCDSNPELEKLSLDAVVAALVTAKANPPRSRDSWVRPASWAPCSAKSAGKLGGTLATAIADLGYFGGPWSTLSAVRRNLGCSKPADPSPPIFAWEVGGPAVAGRTLWERAAFAWSSFLAVGGSRPGTMASTRMHHVSSIEGQCVWFVFPQSREDDASSSSEYQFKDDKRTAMHAPGRTRGLVLDNWRIARYLIPWISLLRYLKFSDRDHLFPAIVDPRRSKDPNSVVYDGYRLLRGRSWSTKERSTGLDFVLGGNRLGRTANGFRHGQTVEFGIAGVAPVVRFRCQLRSLRPLLGSEASYDRVCEDQARAASRDLGSFRIVQGVVGLVANARSPSQGRLNDWVQCAPRGAPPPISAFTCQRCGEDVEEEDEGGSLCDFPGCVWGLCTVCHPDPDAPLLCPQHVK